MRPFAIAGLQLQLSAVHENVTQMGADLGILVTPGRLMTKSFRLTARARKWIAGIRAHYRGAGARSPQPPEGVQAAAFKLV